ncbi:hypothetical protein KFE25_012438 [Diacronema lutheri]|uniref:Trimethylguanosine synthase n=1 Tax=Diacronema lutheri TaxID=2081491 RepID=A0A8J5XLM0_DIALT|nr:hypothetical protein KFE25_012438 [Diacronema lutheri]
MDVHVGCEPRSRRKRAAHSLASEETPRLIDEATGAVRPPFAPCLAAYYARRFELFSRYDAGVRVDATGWFSVTPEQIAIAHAATCAAPAGVAIDAFAGVGGNTVHLAERCAHVIAVEIDAGRAELLAHNLRVYGISRRVDVLVGSFYELARGLRADTLFLSPPWGGPGYRRDRAFDVEAQMSPPLSAALELARTHRIARRCVAFLPRNSDRKRIASLARAGESCSFRAEVDARGRPCALTAVFDFEMVVGQDGTR